MDMLRRLTVPATLLLTISALAACGDSPPEDTNDDQGPRTVVVGANPITDLAPVWLGQEQGIFEEHGIDLQIETGGGGASLIPSVVSGDSQFTFVNPTTYFVALEAGLPLQAVSGVTSSTNEEGMDGGALLVRNDSPVQSPRDLEGRSVATNTLNSIVTTVTRQSVRADGGDPDAIEFVEIGFPDMPAQLDAGNIDAMFAVEPFISSSLAQGMRAIAWPYVDTAPNLPIAIAIGAASTVESDPELTSDFVAALQESIEYANANPDEARRITTTYTQLTAEQAEAIFLPAWSPDIDRAAVETLVELSIEDGIISTPPDLDSILP